MFLNLPNNLQQNTNFLIFTTTGFIQSFIEWTTPFIQWLVLLCTLIYTIKKTFIKNE